MKDDIIREGTSEPSEQEMRLLGREMEMVLQIGNIINSRIGLDEILQSTLEAIDKVMGFPISSIRLLDRERNCLVTRATRGLSENYKELRGVIPIEVHDYDISGLSAKYGRMHYVRDLMEIGFPKEVEERVIKKDGLKSYLTLPIKFEDTLLGVLSIMTREYHEFSEDEVKLLSILANQAGFAIRHAQIYEELKKRNEELSVRNMISSTLSQSLELDEVLGRSVDKVLEIVGLEAALLRLLDESSGELRSVVARGVSSGFIQGYGSIRIGEGITGKVACSGEPAVVEDVSQDLRITSEVVRKEGIRSYCCVPLRSKDKILGTMSVFSKGEHKFTPEDVRLLEAIGSQIAVAIESAKLFSKVSIAKREWENTFDAVTDWITIQSPDFTIRRANKAIAAFFYRTPSSLVGRKCFELKYDLQEPCWGCPMLATLRTREPAEAEIENERLGKLFRNWTYPVTDDSGEITLVVEYTQDITEKKQLELQLIQAEKLSAIGELVSGIAHELNNPLTGIVGFSQVLKGYGFDEEARNYIDIIHQEAVRCSRIVRNLLSFARKHKPERKHVSVNNIIEATLDLLSYQLRADRIQVQADLATDIPFSLLDPSQIQQVFVNIVNNAHQAMKEFRGRGILRVRSTKDDGFIRVEFIDDGPGIPDENLSRIFDPFFTTKVGGTGLGLSISYGIIKEHGGEIMVKSRVGAGSTFIVKMPIREPVEPPETILIPSAKPVERIAGKKILVVDDEEAILRLLDQFMRRMGFKVETAIDGKTAIEKLNENDFDIVVSDLKMPEIGGLELHEYVKKRNPRLAQRIIFTTGDIFNIEVLDVIRGMGNLCVSKPFDLEELKLIIQKVLRLVEKAG